MEWFFLNFEDPAESLPYETREGGFQWVWGGPHDAREELENMFVGAAEDDEILEAIGKVEEHGIFEWTPSERRIDWSEGVAEETDFLLQDELTEKVGALRGQLDDLESQLRELRWESGSIGHNNPPPGFEINLSEKDYELAQQSIEAVRTELNLPDPVQNADRSIIQDAERVLSSILDKIKKSSIYIGDKLLDVVVASAAVEWMGHEKVLDTLNTIVSTLTSWSSSIGA